MRSLTDPGEIYRVDGGGELVLDPTPLANAGTTQAGFYYQNSGSPSGTFAFRNPGGTIALPLASVAIGDSIALPGSYVSSVTYGASSITVTTSAGTTLFSNVSYSGTQPTGFTVSSDPVSGLERITVACYCHGTRIETLEGEVPVEELQIGDKIVTLSGAARPVRWIGRRSYDGRFIVGNRHVLPICVTAGALADRVPARDLYVSPQHALVIDGYFRPAHKLVNGATILQVECADVLEYFHLELDSHDVIFAEGAAAETFIDVGGRGIFHNAAEFAARHPAAAQAPWEPYDALLEAGDAALPEIRAALRTRAAALGRVSRDPDLHVVVDGNVLRTLSTDGRVYRFVLPAGAREVALASRSVVPQDSEAAGSLDPRRLGVPFERAILEGGGVRLEIGPNCAALRDGFHRDEGSHRWTDGRAALPPHVLACFGGDVALTVRIGATELHYPIANAAGGGLPATIEPQAHRRSDPAGCDLEVHLAAGRLSYRLPPPSAASAAEAA